jgi:hypothetical protein
MKVAADAASEVGTTEPLAGTPIFMGTKLILDE